MNFINYKNNFNTLKYWIRISKFSQNNDYNYSNINTNELTLCQGKSTYVNANPINNNRLTLSNTNNNTSNKPSNRSYIGIYDKPGGYQIITTNDCCDNILIVSWLYKINQLLSKQCKNYNLNYKHPSRHEKNAKKVYNLN